MQRAFENVKDILLDLMKTYKFLLEAQIRKLKELKIEDKDILDDSVKEFRKIDASSFTTDIKASIVKPAVFSKSKYIFYDIKLYGVR